jgi:pimeloyl-ACP methyl ester carboxylesterase
VARIGWYDNAAAIVNFVPGALPDTARVEPRWFPTPDGAVTTGLLYRPATPTRAVACVMHPRVDCSQHYLIPLLLEAGIAVWGQRSRSVNNDLDLVHERVLVDVMTAHAALAAEGFTHQVLIGNSGGASLYCLYAQQAGLAPGDRLADDASGAALDLTGPLPAPRGIVLLAPHPGQADMLRMSIDPAVVDEHDPGLSDPALDLFSPENGFEEPPTSAHYSAEFLDRYRAEQLARVRRIDAIADEMLAEQAVQRGGDAAARRRARVSRHLEVHRTDADPRFTDLSLDASERAYGSLLGRRPDVTNFGAVGFAKISTPRAWLSTWSYDRTRAALRHTLPDIEAPTLVIGYRADTCVFPAELTEAAASLGSTHARLEWLSGDHYGLRSDGADDSPRHAAASLITEWIHDLD